MSTAVLVERAPRHEDEGSAAGWIVTLVPLALLLAMGVFVFRFVRQSHRRIDVSLQLQRELLAEVRAIRAAVVKDGEGGSSRGDF